MLGVADATLFVFGMFYKRWQGLRCTWVYRNKTPLLVLQAIAMNSLFGLRPVRAAICFELLARD